MRSVRSDLVRFGTVSTIFAWYTGHNPSCPRSSAQVASKLAAEFFSFLAIPGIGSNSGNSERSLGSTAGMPHAGLRVSLRQQAKVVVWCAHSSNSIYSRPSHTSAGPRLQVQSVRWFGKRVRGRTGFDHRRDLGGKFEEDEKEYYGDLLEETKDDDMSQVDAILNMLRSDEGFQSRQCMNPHPHPSMISPTASSMGALSHRSKPDVQRADSYEGSDETLNLTKREKQLHSIDHIEFEKNALEHSLRKLDYVDVDKVPEVPRAKPPSAELRPYLAPELVTSAPITKHTPEHVGMFYSIGNAADKIPGVLMRQLDKEFNAVYANMLMIRSAGIDLARRIHEAREQTILVEGRRGYGKSALALYAANYAVENDHFVMSYGLGDLPLWHDLVGAINTEPVEGLAYPSVFEMPDMSQRWFHWLRDTHAETLSAVTLKLDHKVDDYYDIKDFVDDQERERNPTRQQALDSVKSPQDRKGTPSLYDYVNYASQHRDTAASLTQGFFRELREMTEFNVSY
eukprot:1367824-Amorphochlora_amoeboformis.AAC.1